MYKDIVGHAAAIERLQSLVRLGRVAHAYIFAGPSGVGKKLVATAFARTLISDMHDLKILQREEDKKEIAIEQVRELIRSLALATPSPRVVIVDEAERMNEESMNAFLKTLEEAPHRTTIILVTSSLSTLLPTIRSRCQTVLFHALTEAEILRILKADSKEAQTAAALADGSAGRAFELVEDLKEWATESADLLAKAAAGDLNPIIEALTKIRDTGKARARAQRTLQLVAIAIRESLRAKAGAPLAARLAPEGWAAGDVDELCARLESVIDHALMIDRNANVGLVVEDALLRS